MKKSRLIIVLLILTIASIFAEYLIRQSIQDTKKIAPEVNDTVEVNKYYNLILLPFKIPLIVTILYFIYELLVIFNFIKPIDKIEKNFD